MAGTNQGKGDAGPDIAANRGVGLVLFQGQLGCKTLEKSIGFPTQETIGGGDEGNEVMAEVGTRA